MKKLSIIISTARDSHGCYSLTNPNKHIFEDLFYSIENQIQHKDAVELIIVDGLYHIRNLKIELENLFKWTFDYKIIEPKQTFWREHSLWHLNSSFNTAAINSKGEYLFFGSDCVHFPPDFLQNMFYYFDRGYCPHAFFLFTLDHQLIVKNENAINDNKFNYNYIPSFVSHNTDYHGYKTTNITYDDLIKNNFFDITMISDIFVFDGRLNNLIIKDPDCYNIICDSKEIIHVNGSWYYGNMTMSRKDFFELNGYSEYFDGFKGLNDCEIGPRYLRLKNIKKPKENDHILAKNIFAYENLQKAYNKDILKNESRFIDPLKLFLLMENLNVIQSNNLNISADILENVFFPHLDQSNLKYKKFYINNQPNFNLKNCICNI